MRIALRSHGIELLDPDNFTAFDVLAPAQDDEEVIAALGKAGAASSEPGHALISVSSVRELADPIDDAWEEQFQTMLRFAESRGWLDDSGEWITAHVCGT